jgi:hypothetical protein
MARVLHNYRRSIKTRLPVQEPRKCANQSLSRLPVLHVPFYFSGDKTSYAGLLRAMVSINYRVLKSLEPSSGKSPFYLFGPI